MIRLHFNMKNQGQRAERTAGKCKLWQSELCVAFLVRVPQSGRLLLLRHPLTCPLQVSDMATAEAMLPVQRGQAAVPLWPAVKEVFPCSV